MHRIILLDKKEGITSGQAVRNTVQAFRAKKAGHSGTLDGFATGLLLIALDEARKAMPVLAGLYKEYTGTIKLHKQAKEGAIRLAARDFTGNITQLPPKKSAVRRAPREREVCSFEFTSLREREVDFRIKCQAGVYIRKLAHDFGQRLGTGAHLSALRRVKVGPFSVSEASLKGSPLGLDSVLDRVGVKKVLVRGNTVVSVLNGRPVKARDTMFRGMIANREAVIICSGGRILALGRKHNQSFKVERVFKGWNK